MCDNKGRSDDFHLGSGARRPAPDPPRSARPIQSHPQLHPIESMAGYGAICGHPSGRRQAARFGVGAAAAEAGADCQVCWLSYKDGLGLTPQKDSDEE